MNPSLTLLLITILSVKSLAQPLAQPLAIPRQDTESHGIKITVLDSLYLSAVHVDSTQAVFKSEAKQEMMHQQYIQLLQDLGNFLAKNDFKWEKPASCFNRIYFNKNGGIDYYIFSFRGTPEEKPSPDQEKEFTRLVNLFIQDYRIGMTADQPFAQCSPITFMPED